MNKIISIAALVLLMVTGILNAQVYNGHRYLHPSPNPVTVSGVAILSPTKWIATGNSGFYMVTTNAGTNWSIKYNFRNGTAALYGVGGMHFFNANTGLIGCTDGFIGRTTNGGATYDSIPSGTTNGIRRFFFLNSTTGYVCGSAGYLRKTTDGGLNWTAMSPGVTTIIYSVAGLDTNTLWVGTQAGNVLKTTNAGLNWTTTNIGTTNYVPSDMVFINPNTGILVGTTFIKRSTDAGATWANIMYNSSQSWFDIAYYTGVGDPGGDSVLYFSGHNSAGISILYRSYNFGNTLDTIDMRDGRPVWGQTLCLQRSGQLMLSGNNVGMVASSTNAGLNWATNGTYLSNLSFADVEYNPATRKIWAVANSAGANALNPIYSTNYGSTWSIAPTRIPWAISTIMFMDGNTGYIAGQTGRVFKSINGGVNWDSLSVGLATTYGLLKLFSSDANNIWAVGGNGIMTRTTNAGANWTTLSTGTTNAVYSGTALSSQNIYIVGGATTAGWIRSSTDGGQTFNLLSFTTPVPIRDIKMTSSTNGYVSANSGLLYRTTDGGSNWTSIVTPSVGDITKMQVTDANTVYINIPDLYLGGRIGKSTNGGLNWTILGPDPTASSIGGFRVVSADTVLCTGSTGVVSLLFPQTTTTSVEFSGVNPPSEYSLEQNYPNPFNPVTTIKFSVSKPSKITLKIYDITGKEIETLFNNFDANTGTFKVNFNASQYSSGVYFYSLTADGANISTKKMMLIK